MVEPVTPASRRKTQGVMIGAALAAGAVLVAGCSGIVEDTPRDGQPSYKSSRSTPPLEIPPDLTSSSVRDTLLIPGVDATYSQYASEEGGAAARSGSAVLPEIDNARIERSGDQRWLVIGMKPEEVWPRIRDFWIAQGFAIETEEPDIGLMETDWAAQYTPLPQGALKRLTNILDKAFYGVAVRDLYRTRIERGAEPGTAEIHISHRGAEQTYIGGDIPAAQQESIGKMVWQSRPSDPELEIEMLSRLMIFLGVDEQQADTLVADDAPSEPRARLVGEDSAATALVLGEDFSRAWRRTGLALDRAGFTVEDRDRSRGLFFVRYAGRGDGGQSEKKGLLSRLKFWESDEGEEAGDDVYLVQLMEDAEDATRIAVLDRNGVREEGPVAQRILALLHEQLE